MARLNNPFVVYGYKGPEYFCDRVSESNKLCSALRNGIKSALRILEDKMLVSHSANDGYSVSDKLFALWLVRF